MMKSKKTKAKKDSIKKKREMEFKLNELFDIVLNSTQRVNFETSWSESLPNFNLKLIRMRIALTWPCWLGVSKATWMVKELFG